MPSLLDNHVLVLNRLWQPVNVCSVRRAFSLLCLGHAQVVHTDEEQNFSMHDMDSWMDQSRLDISGEVVRSISICLSVPRIIVLTLFDRLPKKEVKFTRHNVFERDKYTCQYCARPFETKELNLDHVVPRDKGGKTTWENVVCSCIRCNSKKANKLPHEVNMFPLREPRAPRWRPFFAVVKAAASHDSWRHFLKLDHQTVEVSE